MCTYRFSGAAAYLNLLLGHLSAGLIVIDV